MKKAVLISFAYIAAVIGAGFASGAEIAAFFLQYGRMSFFGLVLAGVFFGVFSYALLTDCIKNEIYDFSGYLAYLMPPFWRRFTDTAVFVFMAVSLGAMSAAAGEILSFALPAFGGCLIFSAVCALILTRPIGGLMRINGVLGAVIIFGIMGSCFFIINFRTVQTYSPLAKITASAVSYSAYNSIAGAVFLCGMSRFLKTRKQALCVAVLNGAGIFALLLALWCTVGIYYGKVGLGEIPMLSIAARQGRAFWRIYAVILFLAVLTTALSNGFGITENLSGRKKAVWLPFACMVLLPAAGFSVIVDTLYRSCGYASLILPVFMVINKVKKRKTEKIKENKTKT